MNLKAYNQFQLKVEYYHTCNGPKEKKLCHITIYNKEKCFDGIENYFWTHGIVVNKKNTALLQ